MTLKLWMNDLQITGNMLLSLAWIRLTRLLALRLLYRCDDCQHDFEYFEINLNCLPVSGSMSLCCAITGLKADGVFAPFKLSRILVWNIFCSLSVSFHMLHCSRLLHVCARQFSPRSRGDKFSPFRKGHTSLCCMEFQCASQYHTCSRLKAVKPFNHKIATIVIKFLFDRCLYSESDVVIMTLVSLKWKLQLRRRLSSVPTRFVRTSKGSPLEFTIVLVCMSLIWPTVSSFPERK